MGRGSAGCSPASAQLQHRPAACAELSRAQLLNHVVSGAAPQVCDFGLGKFLVDPEGGQLSSVAATNPRWLAPETFAGAGSSAASGKRRPCLPPPAPPWPACHSTAMSPAWSSAAPAHAMYLKTAAYACPCRRVRARHHSVGARFVRHPLARHVPLAGESSRLVSSHSTRSCMIAVHPSLPFEEPMRQLCCGRVLPCIAHVVIDSPSCAPPPLPSDRQPHPGRQPPAVPAASGPWP